jgi:hypothetical protein
MASSYRTKAHLTRYSKTGLGASKLELLWILRNFFMLRTAFIIFVLAALSVTSANGSPVPAAKTRRVTVSAAVSHHSRKKTRHSAAVKAGHLHGNRARYMVAQEDEGADERASLRKPREMTKAAVLRPRLVPMPPPLRGSLESLERQNDKTEADGLERIEDEDDLADRIARKMLVPVPTSTSLSVNGNLPESHRYCRPWTARFLADLARIHGTVFHKPLEVSSAVRTVEYQKQLMGINGNAAPAEGDVASPHLTGATIDIAKLGMSRQEMGWMRTWLLPLQEAGKIDVEEEFQQACFHITVYKSYVPPMPAPNAAPRRTRQSVTARAKARKGTQQTEPPPAAAEIASQGL